MIDEFLPTGEWKNELTGKVCTGETRAGASGGGMGSGAVASPVVKRAPDGLVEEIPDGGTAPPYLPLPPLTSPFRGERRRRT